METAPTSRKENDKPRRRWEWLLLLLALLMSFGCVFCASQLALSFWPNQLTPANMLARSQADYAAESGDFQFAALDPAVGAQAATDSARLHLTPTGADGSSPVGAGLLPPTPTPTATPTQPTPTETTISTAIPIVSSTPTPAPAAGDDTPTSDSVPTSPAGGGTSTPQPTPVPSTATPLPPTATPLPPTATPLPPTATPLPPTATSAPPSPPTSPPPPVNNPPMAVNDAVTTSENVATGPIPVLFNDSDSDGTLVPGSVAVVSGPANGSITQINSATGDITYMPNVGFNGIDTFTYQVCDNDGACTTATVTVTVNPNNPPVAMPDTASTIEDTSEIIDVLLNDSDPDGDPITIISAGPALSGTVTINPTLPLNRITYNPYSNISGTDVFTYTISDGFLTATTTVTVTVIPIFDDPPVANPDSYTVISGTVLVVPPASGVLTNDTDPDIGDTLSVITSTVTAPMSGTLTINVDGSFTYTQTVPFVGDDFFTYQAEDAIMLTSNVTTVTISVTP